MEVIYILKNFVFLYLYFWIIFIKYIYLFFFKFLRNLYLFNNLMSSFFIYGAGFFLGSMYISNLEEEKYQFFRKCFYEPHKNYFDLKKFKRNNDLAQSYLDLEYYLKSVFLNGVNFFYYYLYGEKRNFLFYKQQNNFELIRNFEFVNETMREFDIISKNLKERIDKENSIIDQKLLEKSYLEEELKKDFDDKNLDNIILFKENTKDEFTKFTIQNGIQTKQDYDKSILPEIKLQKQTNKIAIANSINESRRLWEERRKENMYDISHTKFETKFKSIADLKNQQYVEKVMNNKQRELQKYSKNKQETTSVPESNYSDFKDLFDINKK